MKTVTATRASRGFSEMLDLVEQGEVIRIVRDGRPVAEIHPATSPSGKALREALAAQPALDDEFAADIAAATALLTSEENGYWPAD